MTTDGALVDDALLDEATRWFVRLHDEQATFEDRQVFEAWLKASPEHEQAFTEIERIWNGLGQLDRTDLVGTAPLPAPSSAFRRHGWPAIAAAAVLLLAAVAGWQVMPAGLLADHRTGTGERRIVALSDGSQVELGPDSALDIAFSDGRRGVRLIAGQAFFTVAREPQRAFVVEAGPGQVEVLGTAFDVRIDAGDKVAVVVTQHAVSVGALGGTQPARVNEGQTIAYDRGGLSAVGPADLDLARAWREDRLVFHDAPLDTVLAELRRYRRGHVQLLGGDLGSRRVTAVFDARRPDAALEAIAASLGLRVLRATSLFTALVDW